MKKKKPKEPKMNKSESLDKSSPDKNLIEEFKKAAKDLYYISETDAPFEAFVWRREKGAEPFSEPNAADVLRFAKNAPETPVREQTIEDFFKHSTAEQDWHTDEDKETVRRFVKLKDLLQHELKNAKVFRVGKVELDVYIVGVDSDGNLAGVKTKAVET